MESMQRQFDQGVLTLWLLYSHMYVDIIPASAAHSQTWCEEEASVCVSTPICNKPGSP